MRFPEADLLLSASGGVIAADQRGRVIFANIQASEAMGRAIAVGSALQDLMPERLRARHAAGFHRYATTGESQLEGRTVRVPALSDDGKEREVDLAMRMFERPDGSTIAIASVSRPGAIRPPDLVEIETALSRRLYRLVKRD